MVNIKQVGGGCFFCWRSEEGSVSLHPPRPSPLRCFSPAVRASAILRAGAPVPPANGRRAAAAGPAAGGQHPPALPTDRPPAPGPEVLTPSLVGEGVDVLRRTRRAQRPPPLPSTSQPVSRRTMCSAPTKGRPPRDPASLSAALAGGGSPGLCRRGKGQKHP